VPTQHLFFTTKSPRTPRIHQGFLGVNLVHLVSWWFIFFIKAAVFQRDEDLVEMTDAASIPLILPWFAAFGMIG
jgi:hypothetical protein